MCRLGLATAAQVAKPLLWQADMVCRHLLLRSNCSVATHRGSPAGGSTLEQAGLAWRSLNQNDHRLAVNPVPDASSVAAAQAQAAAHERHGWRPGHVPPYHTEAATAGYVHQMKSQLCPCPSVPLSSGLLPSADPASAETSSCVLAAAVLCHQDTCYSRLLAYADSMPCTSLGGCLTPLCPGNTAVPSICAPVSADLPLAAAPVPAWYMYLTSP